MALNWVIAGGGTGGHVTPALALGEALREREANVLFLGSDRGLEVRLVPDAGFDLVALHSQQVMGRNLLGKLRGALGILSTVGRARRELKRFAADGLISVGGYAAVPAILAAITMRLPIAMIEPNAFPGRTNRMTARFARRIFVGFEAARTILGESDRIRSLGIPLRRSLVEAFPKDAERRCPAPPFKLLVFGGSQGARQINEAMMAAAEGLSELPVEVFHAAGEADRDRVAAAYEAAGASAEVVVFEKNLPARYLAADLALCRSGALTIGELALAGLPALLVPYPYAADDHQAANARELEQVGAALRIEGLDDTESRAERILTPLRELFDAPQKLAAMSDASRSIARPDAAADIVSECLAMLESPNLPAGGTR